MTANTAITLIVYGWLIGVALGIVFIVFMVMALCKIINGRDKREKKNYGKRN